MAIDFLVRKCNFCGAENSEDAEVCENCGEELDDQNSEVKRGLVFGSRRVLVVFSLVVIIIVGSYFAYYFLSNASVEVEDPQIFLERVEINEIERDWLENSTWQVSATAYFKILNFNDFDL
ncbi:MAG: zinc-ribbon domain-containing protein, partial [Nitrososphaerales archaeon]